MTTVLAVDGTNLAHRAWHASRENGTAAQGYVDSWIARSVEQTGSTEVVVAFDGSSAGHWRYKILPTYKAGRKSKSPEFTAYLLALPDYLAERGWCVFTPEFFEADDVLAAVAHTRTDVVLVTGDRDSLALAPYARLLAPGSWELSDKADVHAKLGFSPDRYSFYSSIKGDSSDKIPGVRGLGPKAANSLVEVFSSVDEFLADLASGGELTAQALGDSAAKRLVGRLDEVSTQAKLSESVIAFRHPEDVPYGPACLRPL